MKSIGLDNIQDIRWMYLPRFRLHQEITQTCRFDCFPFQTVREMQRLIMKLRYNRLDTRGSITYSHERKRALN